MAGVQLAEGALSSSTESPARRPRTSALTTDGRARYLLAVVALAVLYRGAAQIGYALQFAGPVAAIVWLPVSFWPDP